MQFSQDQLSWYDKNGYLLLPNVFSQEEVERMKAELPELYGENSPRRVAEKTGDTIRSVYGSHMTNEVFRNLTQLPRLLEPAEQLLKSQAYVYQFKINAKKAFYGDVWKWHQDYIFWLKEDGLPEPRAVTIVIFLDEVIEFNGPLLFIPGSHQRGSLDVPPMTGPVEGYEDAPQWVSNLTADIKYSIDLHSVQALVRDCGIVAPKGPSGSMLIFHPNIVHGSVSNISPFDRNLVLVSYSSVDNVPSLGDRPDFIISRDNTPLLPVADDSLLLS